MENSATSRICTYEQEDRATSFHQDSSWTSSIDDLLFFDHSTASSSFHDQNAPLFSSSYQDFRTQLYSSTASTYRKRRKVAATVSDDDLEDTATSPPHPATTSKMDGLSSKQKKKQRAMINQTKQIKGKGSEEYGEDEDRIGVGFVGWDNNCSTGLKNIGLCLVPLSMAVNYFG